jgi:hypothetical protein
MRPRSSVDVDGLGNEGAREFLGRSGRRTFRSQRDGCECCGEFQRRGHIAVEQLSFEEVRRSEQLDESAAEIFRRDYV